MVWINASVTCPTLPLPKESGLKLEGDMLQPCLMTFPLVLLILLQYTFFYKVMGSEICIYYWEGTKFCEILLLFVKKNKKDNNI